MQAIDPVPLHDDEQDEELDHNRFLERVAESRQILLSELASHSGCVSSRALRKRLEQKGIDYPRDVIAHLKYAESDECPSFFHQGRSFYSPEAHRVHLERTELDAEENQAVEPERVEIPAPRKNRQEEARLWYPIDQPMVSTGHQTA